METRQGIQGGGGDVTGGLLKFTIGEVLFLLAAIGVVVFLAWGTTILEALTQFNEWVGKKWKEQQERNRRTDDDNQ